MTLWQEMNTITANGLRFAYQEMGEGPLVLCLHGFPDTAETWAEVMPAIAQAGYRVVAPYMRGYPPTEIPAGLAYSALDLGADVIGLMDAFGAEQAIVIGHDWGAFTAYSATNLAPDRVKKLITVAIPHPRTIKPSLGGLWRARHFITFQFRRLAVWRMKRNNFAFLDQIYRRWSPNWQFGVDELAAIKRAYSLPGAVEASLAYYWTMRDRESERGKQAQALVRRKIGVPTLCIVGDSDGAMDAGMMPTTRDAFTGHYDYVVLKGAGHFLHREQPQAFTEQVLKFLQADVS